MTEQTAAQIPESEPASPPDDSYDIHTLIDYCCLYSAKAATYYLSPDSVLKCTRQHPKDMRYPREKYLISFGRPNYYEKRFIKARLKAGEQFPVERIQLTPYKK